MVMINKGAIRITLLGFGLAVLGAIPARAIPLTWGGLSVSDTALVIRYVRRSHRRAPQLRAEAYAPPQSSASRDTVGSIYRGPGTGPYGANTRTGQVYPSCMFDEEPLGPGFLK